MTFGAITTNAKFTVWGAKTGFDIQLTANDGTVLSILVDKTSGITYRIGNTDQWRLAP